MTHDQKRIFTSVSVREFSAFICKRTSESFSSVMILSASRIGLH